ncbi:MAG: SDR family NAD(P)-dependent oxidoreductase [Candidatus Heimdallarchaeota archaeon]|nr:SDR family NAD(P)-dependent oxidoreductase [Candidatus Heimdallarchaeota archaeon]
MVKTAVITGGNRGLGLQICKELAQLGNRVILTARDEQSGMKAVSEIKKLNLEVEMLLLDIDSKKSIEDFVHEVTNSYGSVDLLYNNAAILPEVDRNLQISKVKISDFESTMQTNFLGPLYLTQLLLPVIPENGRIINIAARPSLFRFFKERGHMPAYRISKLAFHAMTVLLAEELRDQNIIVVAVHPGWVRTDMGGQEAQRSVEEGAETPVWLSKESVKPISGAFYFDKEIIEW